MCGPETTPGDRGVSTEMHRRTIFRGEGVAWVRWHVRHRRFKWVDVRK